MISQPCFCGVCVVSWSKIVLESKTFIAVKLLNTRYKKMLQNFLIDGSINSWSQEADGTNSSRGHRRPHHHRLGKLNTLLHATWSLLVPDLLHTLLPWLPKEMQNLDSSENRILDHCSTSQFWCSLAHWRRFCRCLLFSKGLVTGTRLL